MIQNDESEARISPYNFSTSRKPGQISRLSMRVTLMRGAEVR